MGRAMAFAEFKKRNVVIKSTDRYNVYILPQNTASYAIYDQL